MNDKQQNYRQTPTDAAMLRKRAVEQARFIEPAALTAHTPEELQQILHELQVHQIELTIQNEELRAAQAELEKSRACYFELYDLAPVGYLTVSEQGLIALANLTAATLLGVKRSALLSAPFSRYIFKEDHDVYYRHRKMLFESGEAQECELRMIKADSEEFRAKLQVNFMQDEAGEPQCRIVLSDISERKWAEAKLHYLSFHDQLTGLYNRHYLEEEMKRLDVARQLPIGVIMADLNGLKLTNDAYGHSLGDAMLQKAAKIIKEACREEDILCRWGGDEFVLLLPQSSTRDLKLICTRINKLCSNAAVKAIPVSIALGSAVKKTVAEQFTTVLREAEDSMYRQKLIKRQSIKNAMLEAMLKTLAANSCETETHTRKMQAAAFKIGLEYGLPEFELNRLALVITLHDIGKINLPEELLKTGDPLTEDEWAIIKKHPETGYRIAMSINEFTCVAEDVLAHHERWDGNGYPSGLMKNEIPLLARIAAIADTYEVMSNGRPYKKAMTTEEVVAEFKRCSSTQFDPELVELFLPILEADG
jgi:diguanylate cyclase (GGDEF)-like protein/PAS domain S-box-containing protein